MLLSRNVKVKTVRVVEIDNMSRAEKVRAIEVLSYTRGDDILASLTWHEKVLSER